MRQAQITALAVTAIKGTHLQQVDHVELTRDGARGDRRFFLVDERDRLVNGKLAAALQTVNATFEEQSSTLTLRFPDGRVISDQVAPQSEPPPTPYGDFRPGHVIDGPWAPALSELTGRNLRLVMTVSAVDRGTKGAVSLMSRASLQRLAEQAELDDVDGRRFRMLIEVDGLRAHEEDGWVEREVTVGAASVRFEGHVGRCRVTTFAPDSGQVDLPTLDLLRGYRGELDTTEPLAFGIYGRVLQAGTVSVGDLVTVR